jgi:hypothetical protein
LGFVGGAGFVAGFDARGGNSRSVLSKPRRASLPMTAPRATFSSAAIVDADRPCFQRAAARSEFLSVHTPPDRLMFAAIMTAA